MSKHKPIICRREEHNISRRDIDPDALKVLYRLARHNFIAYLVGGGVRDLLLERTPKDFDVSTDASPNQIKKIFKNCFLIGRRFRLAHIKYADKIIETSTFRKQPETENGELLQMDDNEFGTPEEDAKRRDFTINGLFYNVEDFCIIDYVGGLEDLKKHIIRSIGDPNIRFQEDPVRMLRAIRFASRLDFTIEENTFRAIRKYAGELSKASAPRMLEEIYRLFAFNSGGKAFKLLYDTSLLNVISPEVAAYIEDNENNGDTPLIWNYLEALDRGDLITNDIDHSLMLSCIFFPAMLAGISKPDSAITQKSLLEAFNEIVEPFLERYKVPRKIKEKMVKILTMQHRFIVKGRRNFNRTRFVCSSWFLDALALYELHLTATGRDFTRADEWRNLWEERQEEIESSANDEDNPRKKKRNARRRRRKRSKAAKKQEQNVANSPAKPAESTTHTESKKSLQHSQPSSQMPGAANSPVHKPITPISVMQQLAEKKKNL